MGTICKVLEVVDMLKKENSMKEDKNFKEILLREMKKLSGIKRKGN